MNDGIREGVMFFCGMMLGGCIGLMASALMVASREEHE